MPAVLCTRRLVKICVAVGSMTQIISIQKRQRHSHLTPAHIAAAGEQLVFTDF